MNSKNILIRDSALITQNESHAVAALAKGVAHTVGNPLTGAQTRLYLLRQRSEESPEIIEQIKCIENDLLRIKQVVQDLQSYARPSAFALKPISAKQLQDAVLSRLKLDLIPHGINFKILVETDVSVPMDLSLMTEAVVALLKNAFAASEVGDFVRMIFSESDYQSGQRSVRGLLISVEDTGSGISKKHVKHLFDPFYTTNTLNVGMGLAICEQTVSAHGGFLRVESKKGEGSRFQIMLPLSE